MREPDFTGPIVVEKVTGEWPRSQFLWVQSRQMKGYISVDDGPEESEAKSVYSNEFATLLNESLPWATIRAEEIEVVINKRIEYNDWEILAFWNPQTTTVFFPEFDELRDLGQYGRPTPPNRILVLRPNPRLLTEPLTRDTADEQAFIQIPFERWSWDDQKQHWIYKEVK